MTLAVGLAVSGCSAADAGLGELPDGGYVGEGGRVADARVADAPNKYALGDGDLWPNCWADDGEIYAAHGDGLGFGGEFSDIGVNRIAGTVDELEGETLALGDQVGQVWSGDGFTRKPTGMLCVDGVLYLAVQDLRLDFNEAPAATIARSDDHGATWTWDREAPMFDDHVFTTVFFLDYGQDSAWAEGAGAGDWVYAYGLDGNWRDSFDDSVPDPVDLFLARVPRDAVQDRSAWEFFAGLDGDAPSWSADIDDREAVLHDDRLVHEADGDAEPGQTVGAQDLTVISQGGVLYDRPLGTYLYTSWTELTFEFYEAPAPWGPWSLFFSKDWGPYPWTDAAGGGYGTTIPSKYLSDDGRSMWLQANICPCADAGTSTYDFALREFRIAPR